MIVELFTTILKISSYMLATGFFGWSVLGLGLAFAVDMGKKLPIWGRFGLYLFCSSKPKPDSALQVLGILATGAGLGVLTYISNGISPLFIIISYLFWIFAKSLVHDTGEGVLALETLRYEQLFLHRSTQMSALSKQSQRIAEVKLMFGLFEV